MTVDLLARVVFLTADEAPPAEVVRLVEHPCGVAEGRELDSFLAELDAGQDVPGLLVAVGGAKVIETLRRHERTACLPIFCWGSSARVAPGWDGNVVSWNENQLALAADWQKTLAKTRPVAELDEQERREHLFLRYMVSRGVASIACMDVFGLEFTQGALSRWQRNDWIELIGSERLQATAALQQQIWRENPDELPAMPAVEDSEVFESVGDREDDHVASIAADVATVHADVVSSLLQDSKARERSMPTPNSVAVNTRRGFGVRDVLLVALLALITFDLWKRYGQDDFIPPELAETQVDSVAEGPPSMLLELPPSPPPELSLDAHLSWEIVDVHTPGEGVVEWRLAENNQVQAGDTIAFLNPPTPQPAIDRVTLQDQLDGLYQQIDDQQTLANATAATRIFEARGAIEQVQQDEQQLGLRVEELDEIYQRQLKLAQEGILSFREIRPDWQKLQAAKQQLADTSAAIEEHQAELQAALAYETPRVAEDPLWQARISAIQNQMQAPQVAAEAIPVVVRDSGQFVKRIPEGRKVSVREVLGQLRRSGSGQVEAVLATADWDPLYLQGVARLRRPQRSSWMPTKILGAESVPTGLTILRLRLPVGWLDGSGGISLENATQLELRITAPLSSVHESK